MGTAVHGSSRLIYVPLLPKGGRYLQAPEGAYLGHHLPTVPALDSYLKASYERKTSVVELDSGTFTTEIHIPREHDDFAYVVTDEDLIPVGISRPDTLQLQPIHEYLARLIKRVSYSEALYPEQSAYLWSQFITPTLQELRAGTGAPQRKRSWEALLGSSRLVLLGDAGAGKTSCLRRLTMDLAYKQLSSGSTARLPVYIQLRRWTDNFDLIKNTKRQVTSEGGAWLGERVEELVRQGAILLLLDGLDEVDESRRGAAVDAIREAADKYPQLHIVVSSRPSSYSWSFEEFLHLRLEPFTESQIREWSCQRLYQYRSWRSFYTALVAEPDLLELARNPLLLSLTVSSFLRNSVSPHNRVHLLGEYVRTLLDEWDSIRGVHRHREQWAEPQTKLLSLCRVSFALDKRGDDSFSLDDFVKLEKSRSGGVVADKLLRVLWEDTGLIRREEGDEWKLLHSSLRAYFTALHLVGRTDDVALLFRENLKTKRWQEIWLQASGITQDSSHLIDLLLSNRRLRRVAKAELLARLIVQNLGWPTALLERSCTFIVDSIASLMRGVLGSSSATRGERRASLPLWTLRLSARKRREVFTGEVGKGLRGLLRAVYYAKGGPAGSLLQGRLASGPPACREFARIFAADGSYVDGVTVSEGREELEIRVEEESPELRF